MSGRDQQFLAVASWEAATEHMSFELRPPADTLGQDLESLSIHVRDHKQRSLAVVDRSCEAHYGTLVLTQARKGEAGARSWALQNSYGPEASELSVGGHEGRLYRLGPEVPADDIDGRNPSVVVWADGEILYLVASHLLPAARRRKLNFCHR